MMGVPPRLERDRRRGSALLAVLWVSIALGAIAFALSHAVRSEFDRAALQVDSTRAYYLAAGAIDATIMRMSGGPIQVDPARRFTPGMRRMDFRFPSGAVTVEIIGESGKLNINRAPIEAIAAVLRAAGLNETEAVGLAARVIELRDTIRRREPVPVDAEGNAVGNFDQERSFSGGGASIQQLEDLLMVPGMTTDLLFGTFRPDGQGALQPFGGLFRYLTTQGSGIIDANYAAPGTLRAAGIDEGTIEQVLARRELAPLKGSDFRFGQIPSGTPGMAVGIAGGGEAYTLRATATLASGRATRTVAALVEMTQGAAETVRIVRWYEQAL